MRTKRFGIFGADCIPKDPPLSSPFPNFFFAGGLTYCFSGEKKVKKTAAAAQLTAHFRVTPTLVPPIPRA